MSIGMNTNYGDRFSTTFNAQKASGVNSGESAKSLDDFKREVYGLIDKMSIHSSQSLTQISISIADKAFEKMQADPQYKDLMLRTIQRDLNGVYPAAAAPSYSVITIGEDGEYSATAMGSANGGLFAAKSSNSFWERNTRKSSEYDERRKQAAERYEDILARAVAERRMEDKRRNANG